MRVGDTVTWRHVSCGFGYSVPIDVGIVALHARHATVQVKTRSGETVRRRVSLSSLREGG
jgi:hypothetical protein